MREVDTAIGILAMPKELPQEKVDAEIKGINLFKEILYSSTLWKINDAIARRPIIHCRVGELIIKLDPFQTIRNSYFNNDFHFVLKINGRKICVIESHNSDTAIIDPLISLLLLGEAGWPVKSTPVTMEEVSIEQQIINRNLRLDHKRESKRLSFTVENKKDLLNAVSEIENGNSWEGLAEIMQIARTKFVCAMWSMNYVLNEIKPFIDSCNEQQIAQYIENPFESTDRIFLEKILLISNV
ncbi:hypothetical protein OAM96_02165 [Candidatus Poseidoniaceae archaeon]|nr:hypothetical protein [Candidatus Poseidoniaceae archaeon]